MTLTPLAHHLAEHLRDPAAAEDIRRLLHLRDAHLVQAWATGAQQIPLNYLPELARHWGVPTTALLLDELVARYPNLEDCLGELKLLHASVQQEIRTVLAKPTELTYR